MRENTDHKKLRIWTLLTLWRSRQPNRVNGLLQLSSYCLRICYCFLIMHCVKSVLIRTFSGPYFPVFGLVSLRIHSECGKIRTRKTPNTGTIHTVTIFFFLQLHSILFVVNYDYTLRLYIIRKFDFMLANVTLYE